ncbi:MAG: glycosyltransferase family 2 protein [Bacteroidota bacterium]
MATTNPFPDVTLLVTHYNRSRSLERLLHSFTNRGIIFGDIVVSDDGSMPEHLHYLKSLQNSLSFRLITSEKNKGLGNNINKGQDAINTPYTLYVQEDFDPLPAFAGHFADGLHLIQDRADLDIVRFFAYSSYPYLQPLGNGYAEMLFNVWKTGYKKFYAYSDHPHLRRSSFLQKFGRYTEGKKVEKTEYLMMMSFLRKKGKGVIYENIHELFEQKNSSAEPSTVKRNFWRETEGFLFASMRHAYRHLKFNFDYLFRR